MLSSLLLLSLLLLHLLLLILLLLLLRPDLLAPDLLHRVTSQEGLDLSVSFAAASDYAEGREIVLGGRCAMTTSRGLIWTPQGQ